MIATSKPSAPFIPTAALETLARELFNGALPALPADRSKRRAVLAAEFQSAHLTVPNVSKPDAAKLATLAPAIRAIAASRQARVDAFLGALPQRLSYHELQTKLVAALGPQAVGVRLINANHAISVALALIEILGGRDAKLDLRVNHLADGGQAFLSRLDGLFGAGASSQILPSGALKFFALNEFLAGLADAVAEAKSGGGFAASAANPPAQAKLPKTAASADPTEAELGAAIRAESDPIKRAALFAQLQDVWNS